MIGGMNLHDVVRGVIPLVNPDQPIIILEPSGWRVVNYEQVPSYAPAVQVMAQAQPVSDKALQFLNQQRQNSIWIDFYLNGEWKNLQRADQSGGALVYWDAYEWQVDQVLEHWTPTVGWTKIRCVQIRRTEPPEIGDTEPPDGQGGNQ